MTENTVWQAYFIDNQLTFIADSVTFQSPVSYPCLRDKDLPLSYAERNSQTVFKHIVILILAVLTLFALKKIIYRILKIQNVFS